VRCDQAINVYYILFIGIRTLCKQGWLPLHKVGSGNGQQTRAQGKHNTAGKEIWLR